MIKIGDNMRKKNKKLTAILAIVFLLCLGMGYALLSTDLNITGTTVVKDNRWDIHFSNNANVTTGSVAASQPVVDTAKTTVSYSATLNKPGDFYEFKILVYNSGTIDGMISNISSKLNGVEINNNLPTALNYSVTYTDGLEIEENQILEAGDSETLTIRVEYRTDIDPEDLPDEEITLNLLFQVTYIQADDSAQPVPHVRIVYTVNEYDHNNQQASQVWIGQPFPSTVIDYPSTSDVLSAFDNKPLYLKHKVINNIVTESYLEIIITDEMAQANSGMTAGTYDIQGADIWDEVNNQCKPEYYVSVEDECISPYHTSNMQLLSTAFGASNCSFGNYSGKTYYRCSVSKWSFYLYDDYFFADYSDWADFTCSINENGNSSCHIE